MTTFASSSTGKTVPTSPLLSSDVINEKSLVQTLLTAVDENNVFCNFDFVSVTAGETGEDRSRSLRLKQDVNQGYEDCVSTSVDPSDLVLVQIIHTNAKKILGQSLKLAEGKVEEILVQKNTYDA